MFRLNPEYTPKGDQPQAIEKLVQGLEAGYRFQTLLGATGTGKTFTMASVIARVQRPALVIAHNKTLAAQLCQEFRAFFPENAVQFFISYYDYYQPEAYVPQTDTYIEKTASINDEIDRLRHAATQAVLERRDVIVVASVSCIYGLGSPTEYLRSIVTVKRGDCIDPRELAMRLVELQYVRSDMVLGRGTFRIRGDVIDVQPADDEFVTRIELFGDEVERIYQYDPLKGDILAELERAVFFPATHYVTPWDRMDSILEQIRAELEEQVRYFESQGRLIEAQRIRQRTEMDIEMMRELGYCNGIENYSRYFDGRKPGEPPYTLLDYFPEDYIVFIDESHQTIPQLRGMYNGDLQRKRMLVEYGFRLPSAMDNRPLRFEEFLQRVGQVIFVSATPGPYEREVSEQIVEQIIRPTGLLDPEVIVRPTQGQIDDLIGEIRKRIERQERVLVTTLTKKMAEDLTSYLQELGIKVQYLHSDIQSLERAEILRDLRLGTYDVVVGVNLLREGLDLPEVSLVAILDADKEGFLRSETSLIQTIGRAARNKFGQVILYADKITGSMQRAIDETNRRRQIQMEYNRQHGIEPETVRKEVRETVRAYKVAEEREAYRVVDTDRVAFEDLPLVIDRLEKEMRQCAKNLEFERAAILRDEILRLRRILEQSAV
ncbi:MAG: excinuclease ABC subunit UvrB [Fimbriimonadales bacterium]|jgi:excinuclease ABC subunit B|nr:excinuclease ABC subunit UvrB [Armatimonadota bacterium]MCX7687112.1 excinuclease ABC subunit UvrB [Fimbriimonadales bacterium]CUU05017.1 Excinuclease ABC subunit B [Armatimonadetes bacterium GBS]CUU34197.1 Excinuclease ABC subunit B [Armatimonadetes bacterium DC]CUU36319.1 Excinuclease ABC subunit B [Armatimonadetes bacterium GXS]GBC90307.1 UvrABC system protein B [bacterium HR14]